MKFLEKIYNALVSSFKWVFSNFKNFLICLFGIIAIVFACKYYYMNSKYENEINNITDTISVYKNKANELYIAKQAAVLSKTDLKKKNLELYDEIKNLKDNPLVITKTKFTLRTDTIHTKSDTVYTYIDSIDHHKIMTNKFSFKTDYTNIQGVSMFDFNNYRFGTTINSIEMYGDITSDLIEKDNKLYIISKSSNPYLQINNTDGVLVSPEKSKLLRSKFDKKWGVMVGVGPSIFYDNKVKVLPAIQVTIGYKLFSF